MTFITYAVGARASTRYTATANGSALPLWGRTSDTQFTSPYWTAGQIIDQSFATVASDQSLTIVVSLVSGSITSAKVYTNDPSGMTIAVVVSGGTATFTLPADTSAWVEVNGLRGQPLLIASKPLVTQPTGPTVDIYNGTQTGTTAGRTLVFPPGVHTIPTSFLVQSGSNLWFHGEAWVIGSLRIVDANGGVSIGGHGVLSGEWGSSLKAYIRTLPFSSQIYYSLIWGPSAVLADVTISGITLVDSPFFTAYYGVNVYDRATVVAPWWGNQNAAFPAQKWPTLTALQTKCLVYVHDDVFDVAEYLGPHTFTDNLIGSMASASFIVAYWPARNSGTRHTATRNTIVCLNYAGVNAGSIILAWCDGGSAGGANDTATDESFHVVSGVDWDGIRFAGGVINGRPFDFRNRQYPAGWGAQGTAIGQIRDLTIRNVYFETVPTFRSILQGKDQTNTPHDILFENVWYGATRLTAANFDTYFDRNGFPYNIYVDGVPVADVWTTTGSWFSGNTAVSPWSFLPASGRIGGAQVLKLPAAVAWAGTSTPSRGVVPSVGSYDWGASTGTNAASLSSTVTPAPTIAGVSTVVASLSTTPTPTLTTGGGPVVVASLSGDIGPTVTIAGGPVAGASLSASVDLTATMAGAAVVDASLSADIGPAVTAAGGPVVDASAAGDIGPTFEIDGGPVIEAALEDTVTPGFAIDGEAIVAGATSAFLSATVTPAMTVVGEVATEAELEADVDAAVDAHGEVIIDAATDVAVDAAFAIAAELAEWPTITAALVADIGPTVEAAGEVVTTAALLAIVTPEFDLITELEGVDDRRSADLVAIRSALVAMLGRSAAVAGATVTYEAEPRGSAPVPSTATILRVAMLPVQRRLIAHEGEPMIQQDGRMQIQVLFPRKSGMLTVAGRLLAIVARYPAQTVVASVGVTLTGSADVRRVGDENGRVRWDVTIPWRSMRVESAATDSERIEGDLPTLEQALEGLRSVWADRIEAASVGQGWPGLLTYYDDVGPFETPPPLPWAGVWMDAFGSSSREASGPTEVVLGQVLVQIHTDKSLGVTGADRIVERVALEHNRTIRSTIVGPATVTGTRVSPAGTWQTSMRIPFRFERPRA